MADFALRYLNAHHPLVLYAAIGIVLCAVALCDWWFGWRVRNHLVGVTLALVTGLGMGVLLERLRRRVTRPQGGAVLNDVETTEETE